MVKFDAARAANCVIPIGAFCRSTWQIKRFIKAHGANPISYPFDATITPLSAVEKIFSPSFDVNQISVSRKYVKYIDPNKELKEDPHLVEDVSGLIFLHEKTKESARGRFLHTFKHIKKQNNMIFVRWLGSYLGKHCHENRQEIWGEDRYPTYEKLIETLKIFLNNDTFKVVEVSTEEYTDTGDYIQSKDEVNDHLVRYSLIETFINTKDKSWQGSDKVWNLVLNDIMENDGKL